MPTKLDTPRLVEFAGSGGRTVREMPRVAYQVDMGKITRRLKREFNPTFANAAVCTDILAEMIAAGVLLVLEEIAGQGKQRGSTAIMIPGPPDPDTLEPPRRDPPWA